MNKLFDNPNFKAGIEKAKEGTYKPPTINSQWVSKLFKRKEWNNLNNSSYCFLEEEGTGKDRMIRGGFLVAYGIPDNHFPCSDEDLRKIDIYRRSKNIYPFPFKDED